VSDVLGRMVVTVCCFVKIFVVLIAILCAKANFHYASWFEAGSKLVADRFEAGRRPVSNLSATSFEPASNQLA